jgi:hypothetical protein
VADVRLEESESLPAQVIDLVVFAIEPYNLVASLEQMLDKVRSDESSCPEDGEPHSHTSLNTRRTSVPDRNSVRERTATCYGSLGAFSQGTPLAGWV